MLLSLFLYKGLGISQQANIPAIVKSESGDIYGKGYPFPMLATLLFLPRFLYAVVDVFTARIGE